MVVLTKRAAQIFASVNENGDARTISEQEVAVWGTELERVVNLFISSGGLIYSSKAALDADLARPANTMAWVLGDPVVANNGVYGKLGAAGSGSWARRGDLPYSFIIASDAGAGSPNAIQAATAVPVSGGSLVWMNVFESNKGSPVTVSFNGGVPLTVKTNSGNDVAASGLASGMVVLGVASGSTFRLVSDQATAAIVAAAEAAQAAAEAAAASVNIKQVANRTALKAVNTALTTLVFLQEAGREGLFTWTTGDFSTHVASDTAEGVYVKATAVAATVGAWMRVDRDVVNPPMFGALRGRANATVTTAALQAMIEYCEREGSKFDFLGGTWFFGGDGLTISKSIKGDGHGAGYWHPKPPVFGDGLSTVAPTTLVATGTGNRIRKVHGISSCAVSGGVVTNPSPAAGYNDAAYRLTSFMNPVADGAAPRSPRMFSSAIWVKATADGFDLGGTRVITDGGGDDGLDLWLTAGNTATAWGADWDCGIVIEMASDGKLHDFDVVGHWRMFGELTLAIPANPADPAVEAMFATQHANCTFSGRVAVGVRGADLWKVTAVGSDWIEFDWADDHPFDASVFNQFGFGNGSFTNTANRSFTGQTKVAGKLRLTGVSSTSGISAGSIVTTRVAGGGTSHCKWDHDCRFNGIHHTSGRQMQDQALGANAFSSPSAVFEASGWRMTELYSYAALQTIEQVAMQAHALAGSFFIMDWEANAPTAGKSGALIITSPHEAANTRVANPAGKTQFCGIDSARGARNETGLHWGPRYVANAPSDFSTYAGFLEGSDLQIPTLLIDAHGNNGPGANPTTSGVRALLGMLGGILGADGAAKFVYSNEDDKLFAYEHIFPDATTTRDLGDPTHVWRAAYIRSLRLRPQAIEPPVTNGELTIQADSNTLLRFRYQGSDGVIRSGTLALA